MKEEIKNMDIDLTRGYKEWEAKIKNLNGIFEKLENLFDITKYQEEAKMIQKEVQENIAANSKMASNEMQLEFEGWYLAPSIQKIEQLTKKLEEDLLPFYELYLLYSKIDIQISSISAENIQPIIQNSKHLIDALNSLHTHNLETKNNMIEKAYETLYSVILYEELFDVHIIFDYIQELDIPANKENLGRLLAKDLKNVSQEDIIDADLKTIQEEKLGYDYLTLEVIQKISRITVGNENSEYQERRKQAITNISDTVKKLDTRKNNLVKELKENRLSIRNLNLRKMALSTKILSIAFLPIVMTVAGGKIGNYASKKITEYRTITRTVDFHTQKIVNEPTYTYHDFHSAYSATVLSCSPWRKNPTGIGYIRNVVAYDYQIVDNNEDEYHLTGADLENNILEKYNYMESKDELDENDSTTENCILVTETYCDGGTRTSTKFIVPGLIAGVSLGILIDVLLFLIGIYDIEKINRLFRQLNMEIERHQLNNKTIEHKLIKMKEEASEVKDQYNAVVKKYGSFQDELLTEKLDTSWILKSDNSKQNKLLY